MPEGLPETFTCVECLETCHVIMPWPDDDVPEPGDVVVYRCSGCNDRFDMEVPDLDE